MVCVEMVKISKVHKSVKHVINYYSSLITRQCKRNIKKKMSENVNCLCQCEFKYKLVSI